MFAQRGFLVIVADRVGHDLLASDERTIREVVEAWPEVVADGAVDRAALAAVVFNDPGALAELEAIMHPRIVAVLDKTLGLRTGDDVVIEVPLLPLIERYTFFADDRFVRMAVVADRRTRIARAVARGSDAEDVARRMDLQASDDEWEAWADIVIDNSGAWAHTEALVESVIDGIGPNA